MNTYPDLHLYIDGKWVDDVVFGLLSSEWMAKAAELSKGGG